MNQSHLDRPVAEEDKRPLGERLAEIPKRKWDRRVLLQQDLVDHTHRALEGLTPREAEVILAALRPAWTTRGDVTPDRS